MVCVQALHSRNDGFVLSEGSGLFMWHNSAQVRLKCGKQI